MEIGAAQYLGELPSRGYFSSTVPSSTLGGLRVYVCEHETGPPEGQEIKTDQTNILIRSLTLKNPKGKQEAKCKKHKHVKAKRPADVPAEPAKRKKKKRTVKEAETSSRKDGAASSSVHKNYRGYTVDKLKSLLRERGLPVKGKKDELIARLKQSRGGMMLF